MKRTIGTLIVAGLLALPQIALAQTYVEVRGGGLWIEDSSILNPGLVAAPGFRGDLSFDSGWSASVAVGHDFAGPMRFEIEYGHRENDTADLTGEVITVVGPPVVFGPYDAAVTGSVTVDTLLAMGYIDISTDMALTPYVGFGAGVAFSDTEIDGISNSDTGLAFQVAVGGSYKITPKIDLTAGYSLLLTQDIDIGDSAINYTTHNLTAGLRFNF